MYLRTHKRECVGMSQWTLMNEISVYMQWKNETFHDNHRCVNSFCLHTHVAFDENLLWLTVKCHWQTDDGWKNFFKNSDRERAMKYAKYVHQFLLLKTDLEWSSSYAQIKKYLSPTRANNFFTSTLLNKKGKFYQANVPFFLRTSLH